MAQRVEHFIVSAFAFDPSPGHFVELLFQAGVVTRMNIRIPDGHNGKTGIAIFYAGGQIIPFKQATFLRGNNHEFSFDLDEYPTSQAWVAQVFNTDIHPHKFRCSILLDEIDAVLEEPLPSLVLLPPAGGTLV